MVEEELEDGPADAQAIVVHFMLEAIVEEEHAPPVPAPRLVADADARAAFAVGLERHLEAHVHLELRVGRAAVHGQMRATAHDAVAST